MNMPLSGKGYNGSCVIYKLNRDYGGLNKNDPHMLIYVNAQAPRNGPIKEEIRGMALPGVGVTLLKEVC